MAFAIILMYPLCEIGCTHCKFSFILRGDKVVLHERKEMNDDIPDILDVPKSNQHEIAVNCSR
jgi:hypothetical protein